MNTLDKKEYNKVYYEKNKEKQLKYLTEKVNCDICNLSISRTNMNAHKKSKKHTAALEINKYKHIVNNVNNVLHSEEENKNLNIEELKSIVNIENNLLELNIKKNEDIANEINRLKKMINDLSNKI